jgi:putative long chain acyl-CoA synthase
MTTEFEPTMFWDEVRRYGVTVASYTWTLLHDLVTGRGSPRRRLAGHR